jgi:hypothetical protein
MGDDFCKDKAVEIARRSPNQTYVGLLTIKAAAIRETGSDVRDSRSEFLGHADLDHGFPSAPANEPGSAEAFARMTERCQALKKASIFREDERPGLSGWAGKTLKIE